MDTVQCPYKELSINKAASTQPASTQISGLRTAISCIKPALAAVIYIATLYALGFMAACAIGFKLKQNVTKNLQKYSSLNGDAKYWDYRFMI